MTSTSNPNNRVYFFILALVSITLLGYFYVAEIGPFDRSNRFFLKTSDAKEVKRNTPVQFRGLTIGKVIDIKREPSGRLVIELAVDRGVSIARDANFFIGKEGALGKTILVVEMEGLSSEVLFPGDTLQVPLMTHQLEKK